MNYYDNLWLLCTYTHNNNTWKHITPNKAITTKLNVVGNPIMKLNIKSHIITNYIKGLYITYVAGKLSEKVASLKGGGKLIKMKLKVTEC